MESKTAHLCTNTWKMVVTSAIFQVLIGLWLSMNKTFDGSVYYLRNATKKIHLDAENVATT